VITGTLSQHIFKTGADYNYPLHTDSPKTEYQTVTFPHMCFVRGVKFRCCDDGRTYTIKSEVSVNDKDWEPVVTDMQVGGLSNGVGFIEVKKEIKAIRFQGSSTTDDHLHFTMFRMV